MMNAATGIPTTATMSRLVSSRLEGCLRSTVGRVADATASAPGYPRNSVGRSDDAIAVAMAKNSNNGGTARSVVRVVPPQPFDE